jgi:hypothetical protein
MPEAAPEALELFRGRVDVFARAGVSARRRRGAWELRFRLRSPRVLLTDGFSFDSREFRLGRERIRLAGPVLSIVRVTLVDDEFRVVLQEVAAVLTAAREAETDADVLMAEAGRIVHGTQHDPLRSVFARRALRSIRHMTEEASTEAIAAAAAAPTDTEAVVRALQQPETLAALAEADPLLPAKIRGLRERERLLSLEGGTWDAEAVARHLHLTRQGINRRRRTGTLLAIDVGRRGYRYPAWQFVSAGTLPGLESALEALRPHDPWMQLTFMVSPNVRLGNSTPLEMLRAGDRHKVIAAARAFGAPGVA